MIIKCIMLFIVNRLELTESHRMFMLVFCQKRTVAKPQLQPTDKCGSEANVHC